MGEKPELERSGGELLLSKVEIYGTREGGLVEGMVPVELIDRTEVAVDEAHVRELAESMLLESEKGIISGQLSPVLLGHIPGRERFAIIDGFHRDSALDLIGKKQVFATIKLNTTQEDIDDLRILTANSHKRVSFSRIQDWVSTSWERSPWANQITAAQAFGLANNKKMNGRYMGLSEEEAEAIRAWALTKCENWRTSAASIYSVMAIAQVADPELVQKVRARASGHELTTMTQQHLKEIALGYPNQFETQNAIAEVAIDQNLTVAQTKKVLETLRGIEATDDILATIEITDWAALFESEKAVKKTRNRSARASQTATPEKGKSNTDNRNFAIKYMLSRVTIARLQLDNAALRGTYLVEQAGPAPQPMFNVDVSRVQSLQDALTPTATEDDQMRFVERFEAVEDRLIEVFLKNTNASDAEAKRIVQLVGMRISKDIHTGGARFIDFSDPQTFDKLIRTCLNDEIQQFIDGRIAPVTPIHQEVQHFDLSTALEILPTLQEKAQTGFVYSAVMRLGTHTVARLIDAPKQQAAQLLETTQSRLASAERIRSRQEEAEAVSNA